MNNLWILYWTKWDGVTSSSAHYLSPRAAQNFNLKYKLVLNLLTPRRWKVESSTRVPRPVIEPRPLAFEASALPLDLGHLLPKIK